MMPIRNKRFLYAIGLAACLLVYLGYQALVSPSIEFLRPSLGGKWIVHPNPPIVFREQPACANATFHYEFVLERMPEAANVRITTRELIAIRLNGSDLSVHNRQHWKLGATYALLPHLRVGANRLEIQVSGQHAPPALLVEGPDPLCTDLGWKVSLGPDAAKSVSVVLALRGESQLVGKLNPLRTSRLFPVYSVILGLCILICFGSFLPLPYRWSRRSTERAGQTRGDSPSAAKLSKLWREHGFCLVIFLLVATIQIHNVFAFSHTRSHFDWQGHVDYILYISQHWRTPIATEGWEMFQPPLYYFTSALVYRCFLVLASEAAALKAIQVYTTLIGLGNIALGWAVLRQVFPANRRARNLGFSLIAMLPMGFYMNSMISNEIFSGGIIGMAIYLAVRYATPKEIGTREAIIVGIGCGLGLLSKYTGLFVFSSVLLLIAGRLVNRQGNWRWGLVFLMTTAIICGWLYMRNLIHFGDPFIGNWDTASGFHYEQHPGYRTLGFYTRFGSALTHLPEHSRWSSFWDGKYASMWTDTHGTFLNISDKRTQMLSSLSLWLALLPSLAILLGFGKAVVNVFTKRWDHPYSILVLTSVFTVVSLLSFTMEVPTFSTIKAFFFLSLLSSLGVFAALGLDTICSRLRQLRWIVYGNLALLYGLIAYLFWYRGT